MQTAVAGDRIVVTVDVGGAIEIRTFDAKTLRPAGRLRFAASRRRARPEGETCKLPRLAPARARLARARRIGAMSDAPAPFV